MKELGQYTLASGGPCCGCGYKKKGVTDDEEEGNLSFP